VRGFGNQCKKALAQAIYDIGMQLFLQLGPVHSSKVVAMSKRFVTMAALGARCFAHRYCIAWWRCHRSKWLAKMIGGQPSEYSIASLSCAVTGGNLDGGDILMPYG
jgi:hypothetical protein